MTNDHAGVRLNGAPRSVLWWLVRLCCFAIIGIQLLLSGWIWGVVAWVEWTPEVYEGDGLGQSVMVVWWLLMQIVLAPLTAAAIVGLLMQKRASDTPG